MSEWEAQESNLAHSRGVFRLNLVHHALFPGLRVRILVFAEILFSHFVDVGVGALFGDLDHASANFHVAVRIIGINDCESNAGVATQITVFLPSFSGIDDDMLPVPVAPDWCYLRTSVRH